MIKDLKMKKLSRITGGLHVITRVLIRNRRTKVRDGDITVEVESQSQRR